MSNYNIDAGRTPEQIEKMKKLAAAGLCAFCRDHFDELHESPIEHETDHWLVSKNDYPYEHTKLHLLIISKAHVKTISELSTPAKAEFLEVVTWIEKLFALNSFGVGMRVGDFRYNGGSVDHLHAHVLVGTRERAGFEPVRMKLTSLPKS